jgi:sec-independent protein translocase protein TatB
MIVLFVVVLVIFGPNKLPELARGLGKLMAEFRKASTDFKSAFEEEMREMERQARINELKKQAAAEVAAAESTSGSTAVSTTPSDLPALRTNVELQDRIEPVISHVSESVARTSEDDAELAAQNAHVKVNENGVAEVARERDPIHDK